MLEAAHMPLIDTSRFKARGGLDPDGGGLLGGEPAHLRIGIQQVEHDGEHQFVDVFAVPAVVVDADSTGRQRRDQQQPLHD